MYKISKLIYLYVISYIYKLHTASVIFINYIPPVDMIARRGEVVSVETKCTDGLIEIEEWPTEDEEETRRIVFRIVFVLIYLYC